MKLLHPHFIKCEKPKSELNLTFSAMVKVNGEKKISKIQKVVENVIKKQEMLKGIEMEDKPRGLYKRIRLQSLLYKNFHQLYCVLSSG